jgi:hypothetical protein
MSKRALVPSVVAVSVACLAGVLPWIARAAASDDAPAMLVTGDASGLLQTLDVNGRIDLRNAFFQDLGTNGRRCVSCHQPDSGWSLTPGNVIARFELTRGMDPIFTSNDGSVCEGVLPLSLRDKRAAYALLLSRGLIRVGLDVPPGAEFAIDRVEDPYHCGFASNDASLFRRPLPSTNLRFLTAVMWDGRESSASSTLVEDLLSQANDATLGHAQAAQPLTAAQAQEIVGFEMGLFTAQARDNRAGSLSANGAAGGPLALSRQPFFVGINDPVGLNPSAAEFTPVAFSLFDPWAAHRSTDPISEARRSIARGERIFDTKPIAIAGVAGLNGETFASGVTVPDRFVGTCTTCHDSPNVGNHSVKAPLDLGLTDPSIAPYLPVYTLRNLLTQETVRTTDPGRAMITGRWRDIGKFKGPVLRGLAARAPYFHNGSARTLDEVVDFYDRRFGIGLTLREKRDLAAFLGGL